MFSRLNVRHVLKYIGFALIGLVVLTPTIRIHFLHNLMPFGDEFGDSTGLYFLTVKHHAIGLSRLLQPHMEHRLLFTRLIYLLQYHIAPASNTFVIWCSYLFNIFAYAVFVFALLATNKKLNNCDRISVPLLLAIALLAFPSSAYMIWQWQFIIQFPMTLFFIFASLLLLAVGELSWPRLCVCLLLSLGATFSSSNGLLVWPLCFLALAFSHVGLKKLAVYLLAGAITIALYMQGIAINDPGALNLYQLMVYFFSFFGNIMVTQERAWWTFWLGVMVFSCYLFTVIFMLLRVEKKHWCYYAPWLILGGFSVANALLGGLQRSHMYMFESLSPRYVHFGAVIYLSLLASWSLYWPRLHKIVKLIFSLGFIAFLSLLALIYIHKDGSMLSHVAKDTRYMNCYAVKPTEVALPYKYLLTQANDVYPPSNAKIKNELADYYHSAIYSLGKPHKNYMDTTLHAADKKQLGMILSTKNFSIEPKRFVPKHLDVSLLPPEGFTQGEAVKGNLFVCKKRLMHSSHQLLLLDSKDKVCGQVIANDDGKYFGFTQMGCTVQSMLLLNKPVLTICG